MKYKYILFDIDSTLINYDISFDLASKELLCECGVEVSEDTIQLVHTITDNTWFDMELDRVDCEHIRKNYHKLYHECFIVAMEKIATALNINMEPDVMVSKFLVYFGANATPNPNSIEICERLSKDHVLCVATNGIVALQPLKLTKYNQFLTKTYISEAVGHIKPEKEYFNHILKDLNATSTECLMIGDSLANDIDGANQSGIDSCYYNPSGEKNTTNVVSTYEIRDFMELLDII